jgi:UPF0176 protein
MTLGAEPLVHSAFYRFARLGDPRGLAVRLRALADGLLGSIVLAEEGINGMMAGPQSRLLAFEQALLQVEGAVFAGMSFKHSACTTPPFGHLRIKVKREIVALGLDAVDAVARPRRALDPWQWREFIARDDVVVLDNRNHFEVKLGKFKGAMDPGVDFFRDFPRAVRAAMPGWLAQGKTVGMYCTGGIRCEKTSAWLLDQGIEVVELEGGILNYFQTIPDAQRDWEGRCFVFDNRIALDTRLQESPVPIEEVYQGQSDAAWRIRRAQRLAASASARQPAERPAATVGNRDPRIGQLDLPAGPQGLLLDYLAHRFASLTREEIAHRMREGEISWVLGEPLDPATPYEANRVLVYRRKLVPETPVPFQEAIIYEDDHILVADKPPFLTVVPAGQHLHETLMMRLRKRTGISTLVPAHRIDRETRGLVLFTKHKAVRGAYQGLFEARRVHKVYEAIAPWNPAIQEPTTISNHLAESPRFMQMHAVEGRAANAQTTFEPIERHGDWVRYRVTLSTGRKHQIRAHAAQLGIALRGDRIYPELLPEDGSDFSNPLDLLAQSLAFRDPLSGAEVRFESRQFLSFDS